MSKLRETNKKIEETVVGGYKKVEDTVVSGYKKVEDTVVSGYKKMEELKDIVITEDLNITPRYANDFKLFNIEELNIDLIYEIIFVIIVVFAGIYVYKNKKK